MFIRNYFRQSLWIVIYVLRSDSPVYNVLYDENMFLSDYVLLLK